MSRFLVNNFCTYGLNVEQNPSYYLFSKATLSGPGEGRLPDKKAGDAGCKFYKDPSRGMA